MSLGVLGVRFYRLLAEFNSPSGLLREQDSGGGSNQKYKAHAKSIVSARTGSHENRLRSTRSGQIGAYPASRQDSRKSADSGC